MLLCTQVKKCGGGYIDVPYIEDAVLVNLGALMQKWTSDRYMATVHHYINFIDINYPDQCVVPVYPDGLA